jgi:alkyl hydroperoxide reductase subunit F
MKMSTESSDKVYDLIIIGGGPAGLTAATYAIRKRIETILISEDLGGKTNYKLSLPNVETHLVIDGEELVSKFKSQIEYLDFARHLGKVTKFRRVGKKFVAKTSDHTFTGQAAIIATGVLPKRLNVPGEEEFLGHGVSYSAVSHAQMFIDMDVAVVGNGIIALQAAAELVQIARKVHVIGISNKLRSSTLGKKITDSGKAEYHTGTVKAIQGNSSPEKIILDSKTGQKEIPVRGVFIELGYIPTTAMFSRLVKMNSEKRIIIDENNQTNVRGLFAAGDVTNVNANQVLIAVGEGANAALSAYNYLLTLKT